MIDGVRTAWRTRTPRERRLLLVLAALVAAILAWFAVLRPLDRLLADARLAHAEALDAEAAARGRAARLAAIRAGARRPLGGPLATVVRDSAVAAGFAGTEIAADGPGRVRATMPTARAVAVLGWLSDLNDRGIVVHALSLAPATGGTVSVSVTLGAGGRG